MAVRSLQRFEGKIRICHSTPHSYELRFHKNGNHHFERYLFVCQSGNLDGHRRVSIRMSD